MDDSLERPTSIAKPEDLGAEEEQSSADEEDQGPDWTKIPGISRPVIPKRGEKDFEPIAAGGSGLQRHVLDRSRNAMFDALRATPAISSKSVSHAIWYPELARAHVTVARGIHFTNMGHSIPRPTIADGDVGKMQRRLELLPEETLYLVERGAMFCWEASQSRFTDQCMMEDATGVPMSVQQAFAEMIGKEGLTLEKYQVFAYLRRLGYVAMRAKPPNREYPTAVPLAGSNRRSSLLALLEVGFRSFYSRMISLFSPNFDWWRPTRLSVWLRRSVNYICIFNSLRFLRTGFDIPLNIKKEVSAPSSPYEIFYHLYKPSTPFKKTAPPPPDYHVVVVNARTTPIPSISELTALFGVLPELPPPMPRRRQPANHQEGPQASVPATSLGSTPEPLPIWRRIFSWAVPAATAPPPRPVNPFLALKTGKKMVVVAAVDASTISFFRFGQGSFEEWPMH